MSKDEKRVWVSSPRRTDPRVLERTGVFPAPVVDRLVDQIAESATTSNRHYNVLVGAPGSGKSHLLATVCHRVAKLALDDLAVAWLPDEPGALMTELNLLEEILLALGDDVAPLRRRVTAGDDRDAASAAARRRLREVLAGRTLLLCVEDLDRVLASLGELGQRGLRGFLQEERSCTLLATARELTADFTDQGRPFFGFFSVQRVDDLDAAAVARLLGAHARVRGDADLAAAVKHATLRPTLRALHHILGGRPLRYVDLIRDRAELCRPEALLLRALDEDARWQRVRREQLSPQQRLILHWLSRQRGAVQVKHIARGCFIAEQTVSPQLRALRGAGLVRSTRVGREAWYEVRDPLNGIEPEYALELFAFLQTWFEDREAALALDSGVARRVREAVRRDADGDPRLALAMPRLERSLAAPGPVPADA